MKDSEYKMEKEISVIIPVYNSEKYLDICISSLLSQTVINKIEIILVDDGSADKSSEILDGYMNYPNISVYHTEHKGVSHARNIGIQNANGKYIAFIDSDDYIEKDYFEELLREFSGQLICGGFTAEYQNKSIPHICSEKTELYGENIIKEFLREDMLSPIVADKLFLKDKINGLYFDEGLQMAEDRYFLFEYLKRTDSIKILPLGKYHYMMNDDSVCRNTFDERKIGSLTVCRRITESIGELYPSLLHYARCSEIDMKCRVYGEIYYFGMVGEYSDIFKELKKEIRHFDVFEKIKYSSRKHTFALITAKISPKLYMFLKNNMKLQYKQLWKK